MFRLLLAVVGAVLLAAPASAVPIFPKQIPVSYNGVWSKPQLGASVFVPIEMKQTGKHSGHGPVKPYGSHGGCKKHKPEPACFSLLPGNWPFDEDLLERINDLVAALDADEFEGWFKSSKWHLFIELVGLDSCEGSPDGSCTLVRASWTKPGHGNKLWCAWKILEPVPEPGTGLLVMLGLGGLGARRVRGLRKSH